MMKRVFATVLALVLLGACTQEAATSHDGHEHEHEHDHGPAPEAITFLERSGGRPELRVVEPVDGAVVEAPFVLRVETDNLELAAAGRTLDGEGHFHVMVDRECLHPGEVIPKDQVHLHVGSGADTLELDLPPGTYDLCAQIGDGFHVAVAVADTITVNVVSSEP